MEKFNDHDSPPSTPPGPQSVKNFVKGFITDYPDLQVQVIDVIAEGDRAAARLVWRGHHRETGEPYRQMGIVFLRLNEQGQLAERWSAYQAIEPAKDS
jgi:predicted ester cyclase